VAKVFSLIDAIHHRCHVGFPIKDHFLKKRETVTKTSEVFGDVSNACEKNISSLTAPLRTEKHLTALTFTNSIVALNCGTEMILVSLKTYAFS
jgi:hypothetical protein